MFWRPRDVGLRSHAAVALAVLGLLAVDSFVLGTRGAAHSGVSRLVAGPASGAVSLSGSLSRGAHAEAVASGHGELWVLARHRAAGREHQVVEEIDPRTGQRRGAFEVPAPASYLFYGADRVWVVGNSSGARITALNPVTSRLVMRRLGRGTAVRSVAFGGTSAYVAVVGRDEVLKLRASSSRLRATAIEERGGPVAVVTMYRAVEVTSHVKNLVPIIFRGANTSFLAALQFRRPVVASAGKSAAWVRYGHAIGRETVRADGRLNHHLVPTRQRPLQVVMAPHGGCYVSVARGPGHRSAADLLYFSRRAVAAAHPRPTAVHRGAGVRDLAVDPAGGVAYVTVGGTLAHWRPPGFAT